MLDLKLRTVGGFPNVHGGSICSEPTDLCQTMQLASLWVLPTFLLICICISNKFPFNFFFSLEFPDFNEILGLL